MEEQPIILITGTRKGIGRFLVDYYIKKGFKVIGCSRGSFEEDIEGYEHYLVDVTDEREVSKMIKDIYKKYTKLDVVINNAGIASMNHMMLTPTKTVEKILNTNVIGTFNVSREASKLMMRRKYGRIINFGTVAVPLKIEGEAVYAASKNAVVSLTQVMAKELAQYNITCNVVGPAPIATDLIANVPKEKIQQLIDKMTIKRLGKFEDVANVIDFFIKKESNYITGQVIYLGGV
ncbi:SDR family oxidoreductase [Clostridium formicaceticum]|uniref:3-oxoacyl-[acyl-carrier-protein] reductase FabG n=1 Tax=Clostridium formicaceticum TaxID=1497 RepID=A0AAC9RFV2_9CLOT|nr:SDR family oxidoreductase [Clostridium formicaceticum]AOY75654.1 oxidoreductase [Clostridium formicaceticum]ARE85969.1 3-oxoacyl-[acyl-carrier-protein] reductase FabG [Clostridium formicaceticum]